MRTLTQLGFAGDGVTLDDGINAAIAGGGAFEVDEGKTFLVSGLALSNNLRLEGLGTFKLADGANANVLFAGGKRNIRLDGFGIEGNWRNQTVTESKHGLRIDDCLNVRVRDLNINGCNADGISLKSGGVSANENITIEANTITDCGRNGIAVLRGRRIRIIGNDFDQIGLMNIDIEPNTGETAEDIVVMANTGRHAPWGMFAACGSGPSEMVKRVIAACNPYTNDKTKRTGVQTGNATATSGNIIVQDSAADYIAWGILPGDMMYRTVVGAIAGFKVVSVDGPQQLTVRRMYGSAQTMAFGDTYTFFAEYAGFRLQNSDHSILLANTSSGVKTLGGGILNTGMGLNLEGVDNGAAIGNIVKDNEGPALRFTNTNNTVIGENNLYSDTHALEGDGEASTKCKITGNKLASSQEVFSNVGKTHFIDANNTGEVNVHLSAVQSTIANSGPVKVRCDAIDNDINGWFDLANNRMHPKQPGLYEFKCTVTLDSLASGCYLRTMLVPNSSNPDMLMGRDTSGATMGQDCTRIFHLRMNGTTDYAEMCMEHNDLANPAISAGGPHTRFEMRYIGR